MSHKLFIHIDGSAFDAVDDKPRTVHEMMKNAQELKIKPITLEPDNELAYDISIITRDE